MSYFSTVNCVEDEKGTASPPSIVWTPSNCNESITLRMEERRAEIEQLQKENLDGQTLISTRGVALVKEIDTGKK